jgi:ADP-heptose:LPS heptosyltransferase
MKKVLIIRPDGIGDLVLSLPVATQLRALIPDARVGFLTSPAAAPILDHHPEVDFVRTLRWTDSAAATKAAFSQIDAAIFLKPFRRLMWAAFLARVPLRVATGFRWYSVLANRRVFEHRSDFSKHESEYNVGMLKGLGLNPQPVARPRLAVTDAEREHAEARWRSLPHPRVVIHPGGVSTRRWRPERFGELAATLSARGFGVALTGNPEERRQFEVEALTGRELLPQILNCMGILSVRELMGVIAAADVVVSGSTGPAHLAAALGKVTVSVFDPRLSSSPRRWKPLGQGLILLPEVPNCPKCIGEACPYWDCLDRITVDHLAGHLQEVVQGPTLMKILPV